MDTLLDFIAAVIGHLAWPLVALIIAFLFRQWLSGQSVLFAFRDGGGGGGSGSGGVSSSTQLDTKTGRLVYLRAHDRAGYGPPSDFLDADVIVRFENDEQAYGFKLRPGAKQAAAEAMFTLLRDAFNHDTLVTIDYIVRQGRQNHELFRVWRSR